MKRYLVFLTDLGLAPLQGENPRGGRIENFDEPEQARTFAEKEKNNWDQVFIFDRAADGGLERLEHYQSGQRYIKNVRVK